MTLHERSSIRIPHAAVYRNRDFEPFIVKTVTLALCHSAVLETSGCATTLRLAYCHSVVLRTPGYDSTP
eukprot:2361372-Pyramimonas_sp.AAC.1